MRIMGMESDILEPLISDTLACCLLIELDNIKMPQKDCNLQSF